MGEAKRRKASRLIIPNDVKADIARCVRSVNIEGGRGGGTCWFRQGAASVALHYLGIPNKRQFGGMVYRAGPDPMWDVVAFCSHNNMGAFTHDAYLGHAWIESDGDLIDFTVGDWKAQHDTCIALGAESGADSVDIPVNWTAPTLPDFFWSDIKKFRDDWRDMGEPPIGEAWYGPLAFGITEPILGLLQKYIHHSMGILAPAIPHMLANIDRLHIKERLGTLQPIRR